MYVSNSLSIHTDRQRKLDEEREVNKSNKTLLLCGYLVLDCSQQVAILGHHQEKDFVKKKCFRKFVK